MSGNGPRCSEMTHNAVLMINLLSGILGGNLVYVPPASQIVGDERNPSCSAGLAKRNSEVNEV